jgi:hypothetical protein
MNDRRRGERKMDGKNSLRAISVFFAAILSLSLLTQTETNLSGLKINIELKDFSRTEKNNLELRGKHKKPLRTNSQGQPETQELSRGEPGL